MSYHLRVLLTEDGRKAVMDEAGKRRITAAELVRRCVAAQLARPEITNTPPQGRWGHEDVRGETPRKTKAKK